MKKEYFQMKDKDKKVLGDELFRASVESLLDGFAIFSSIRNDKGNIIDFRYEYINEAGCRLNRRSREEHIGHTILELLPEHKKAGLIEEYAQVVETGKPLIKEEYFYEDVYGEGKAMKRYFDFRAVKHSDGFTVTWRDITERKRTEEEIKSISKFPDENPNPVLRVSSDGILIYANKSSLSLLEAWGGCRSGQLLPPHVRKLASDAIRSGLSVEHEVKCRDVIFSLLFTPIHGEEYINIYGRDITGRKRAEMRLALQYDIVRIIAESDGIDETMQKILKGICGYNGWVIGEVWLADIEADKLRLESIWHKISPDSNIEEFISASKDMIFSIGKGLPGHVLASGRPEWVTDVMSNDYFMRKPLASKLGLHAAFAIPIKGQNRVLGVMSFFSQRIETPDNDLLEMIDAVGKQIGGFIERKRMEERLEEAHKLEAVGILAGGIAHDYNNLLTAILGNIALAKMHISPNSKDFMRLTDAEDACHQAAELSKRIITFSKGGAPIRKPALISKIISEAASPVLSGSNILLDANFPKNLYPVYIDEGQIKQCFRNIITNAGEAMNGGGVIRVSAENIAFCKDEFVMLKEGNYVKVSIKDSGIGIPKDILPKIFDPYFTTKEMGAQKGLGLGLSICYSIIKKHGGHIAVESKPGEGTTFHIYLPAAEES
jgi:PAS domain S-box-containing protein